MSFLFKARNKTPAELVKVTKEALLKIDQDAKNASKVTGETQKGVCACLCVCGQIPPWPSIYVFF